MNFTQDLSQKAHRWHQLIQSDRLEIQPVVALGLEERLIWLDLSGKNARLASITVTDTLGLQEFITQEYSRQQGVGGIGGYMEDRQLYRRSTVFAGEEPRSLHLGVDIWLPAETPLYAPLAGTIHSFADNAGFGNYGPTLILEHQLEDSTFYTLYGHLSRQSLQGLAEGQPIEAGAHLARLGRAEENGDWPPHLHFQIMLDMEGNRGDYPGVAAPSRAAHYRMLCPDPKLLLNIPNQGR
jgi:peptidoglycan LD-endopeptidase LytH